MHNWETYDVPCYSHSLEEKTNSRAGLKSFGILKSKDYKWLNFFEFSFWKSINYKSYDRCKHLINLMISLHTEYDAW